MLITIIIFLALLSVLVIVHEFGHYYAAKKSGMDVLEFGLGFPPRIFSWKDKSGMLWTINAIPLGGFVKIKGEAGDHKHDPGSFANKSLTKRFIVLVAGVVMNFVLAAVLLSIGFMYGLPSVVEGGVSKYATVIDQKILVADVLEDSPAAGAGIELGDTILTVNGVFIEDSQKVRDLLKSAAIGDIIELQVEHEGESVIVAVQPTYLEEIGRAGVGVALLDIGKVKYPFYIAPFKGIEATASLSVQIPVAIYMLSKDWINGEEVGAELAGPVGIARLTGDAARSGLVDLLYFAALLSVNLAILNILPFPALDGGRIVFVIIEAIRGKPANHQVEAIVHNLGFAILMLLVIVVTYKDIVGLIAG